jgi:DNA-binding NarL/FixJ family response regulator
MPPSGPINSPTPREQQILEFVCQGYPSKEIARSLGISPKTVACHRLRLMDKAGVRNGIELFRWALGLGLLATDGRKPST